MAPSSGRYGKSPKDVVRLFSEGVVNKGDFKVLDELVAENVEFSSRIAGVAAGRAGVRQIFEALRNGFPGGSCTILDLIVESEIVAERFVFEGVHEGEFHGIAPTGRRVQMDGMAMFRIVDGMIVARWGLEDQLGLMQQLGAG
jgi:predicted ester cyclase